MDPRERTIFFSQFYEEYQSQNKDDIGRFREKIIQELNKNEKNAIFIADYREIEEKINENPDNENPNYKMLKEFYIGYIIQLCQEKKKPKILEIIDELKSCLSKSNDKEILDFLKSINDIIDNKTNDQTNENVIELKKIWEKHERHIDTGANTPDNKKIDRLCFLLNVVDAVKDEDKKSKLRTILEAEIENFLKKVANYAKSFDPPTPTTEEDNDDFLGLGKFLSDFTKYSQETAGAISKFVESIINAFTKKSDESPLLSGSSVADESPLLSGSSVADESGHGYDPNSNQNQRLVKKDSSPRELEQPNGQISGSEAFRLFNPIEKLSEREN